MIMIITMIIMMKIMMMKITKKLEIILIEDQKNIMKNIIKKNL